MGSPLGYNTCLLSVSGARAICHFRQHSAHEAGVVQDTLGHGHAVEDVSPKPLKSTHVIQIRADSWNDNEYEILPISGCLVALGTSKEEAGFQARDGKKELHFARNRVNSI